MTTDHNLVAIFTLALDKVKKTPNMAWVVMPSFFQSLQYGSGIHPDYFQAAYQLMFQRLHPHRNLISWVHANHPELRPSIEAMSFDERVAKSRETYIAWLKDLVREFS